MGNYTVRRIDEMEAIDGERVACQRPEPFKLGAPDPTAAA
jgi:hypothetical protein